MKTKKLIKSIKSGSLSQVQALIAQSENINIEEDGWSALHWAAQSGNPAIVSLLIEHGAVIDAVDDLGVTPLAIAVGENDLNTVKVLVLAGADVSKKIEGYDNGEVIHLACSYGYTEVAVFLTKVGKANLEVKDKENKTALDFAKEAGANEILEYYQNGNYGRQK